jgi:hypothetical protein
MSDVDTNDSQTSVVESLSVDSVSEPPPATLPAVPEAAPPAQSTVVPPAAKPTAQPKTEQPATEPVAPSAAGQPAQPKTDPAATPAKSAAQDDARTVYVYRDYCDASNKYNQPAFMGNIYSNVPLMNHRAEGINGSTGIEATVNFNHHNWGGYFFTVPVFDEGSDKPRPGYGNDKGVGLDLTGAKKLTFYAKGSEGGERVEFFTAGLGHGDATSKYPDSSQKVSLGYVSLTTEWKKYEIDVSKRNMSSITCGFGWAASNDQNSGKTSVRFFFDEVRFEF